MLITRRNNLDEVLEIIFDEIKRSVVDRKHPFRYLVFSSSAKNASSRYVVLRGIDSKGRLMIYTDGRSRKVEEIRKNNQVQLLFFHPRKKVQVIISGLASLADDSKTDGEWESVQGYARKSYTTAKAPGTPVIKPEDAFDWDDELQSKYFRVILVDPFKVEILQLDGQEHLRAIYNKETEWKGSWVVP
jgi:general stress protein 26